ncbi:MAG: hypothetical protein Q9209_004619 [Squamulea sp. 1 TL-2023]
MTSHHGKATDDTSIRPVSSLRSHFERITNHDHSARTPLKRVSPDDLLHKESSASGSYLSQRLSLDTPRPKASSADQSNTSGSQIDRYGTVGSDLPVSGLLDTSTKKRDPPVSSHPPILRHDTPPSITIHSPSSYSTSTSVNKNQPLAPVRTSPSGMVSQQEKDVDVVGTLIGPTPNRATKPNLQSQSGPILANQSISVESEVGSRNPTSQLPSTQQSQPRLSTSAPLADQRPKPKEPHGAQLNTHRNVHDRSPQTRPLPLQPRVTALNETISDQLSFSDDALSSSGLPKRPLGLIDEGTYKASAEVQIGNSSGEGLDGSSSSRRPPCARAGTHVFHTNYDTKLFDMCAGFASCVGQLMRVWDLSSGKVVLSLALAEKEVKATALAFKPGTKSSEEGSRLWIGTNFGDLQELDIVTHKKVSSNLNVHNGREIIRIYRYQNAMWTLDEDGSLYIWPPGDDGLPTLEARPSLRKVPRGHVFSIVVGGLLWFATRTDVRVFRPSTDEHGEFNMEQQPSSPSGVGEITSGAVVESQLDKIYFGHSDGKISIYSTSNFVCLGIVNVSVYKINCLVGAGGHLWAGYNTGRICVYDTQNQPWKVIKDYHAHEGPVVSLSVDRSSLWMSGQMRVGSLSLDNTIRLWDGLLEEDWLGEIKMLSCLEYQAYDTE